MTENEKHGLAMALLLTAAFDIQEQTTDPAIRQLLAWTRRSPGPQDEPLTLHSLASTVLQVSAISKEVPVSFIAGIAMHGATVIMKEGRMPKPGEALTDFERTSAQWSKTIQ